MIYHLHKNLLQLFFHICFFNGIFLTIAMEEENSEIKELPKELLQIIKKMANNPKFNNASNTIILNKNHYIVEIESYRGHYLTMTVSDHYGTHVYSPGVTLNSLTIDKAPFAMFTQQGWYGERGDNYGYFRIDDDRAKKRYLRNEKKKIGEHFFDGINDHGTFMIIAHYAATRFTVPRYNFYLGKMTDKHTSYYSRTNNSSFFPGTDNKQPFDYESRNNRGKVLAFALCKTSNRCALVDDQKKITVFDINDNEQSNGFHVSGLEEIAPATIKKISFITPTTLLALSEKGKLFIVAADQGKPIHFFKQRFKKNDNTDILFSHCAVDPCNPNQIMLFSKDNKCIYWDLLYKQLLLIKDFKKCTIRSLWFYNSSLGILFKPTPQYNCNDDNFFTYNFKFYPVLSQFFKQYKKKISKTSVTPFEKKVKKILTNKYSFVKPLVVAATVLSGLGTIYLYAKHKDSFSQYFEKLPSFFNKISISNIFKFLHPSPI